MTREEVQRPVGDPGCSGRTAVNNGSLNLACFAGTMIEVPRVELTADKIAQTAEFFSFGTNDLTPTSWSCRRVADNRKRGARAPHRRDDSGNFLPPCTVAALVRARLNELTKAPPGNWSGSFFPADRAEPHQACPVALGA